MKEYSLMGIVNLTPDSFVSGDRLGSVSDELLVSRVGEMIACGTDIVDIGACSTAPGNFPVDLETERTRMEGALETLFRAFPQSVFSIDTFRLPIIEMALDLADGILGDPQRQIIVNDVTAGRADAGMLSMAASLDLSYIAVDNTDDPYSFFGRFSAEAERTGLKNWILDPGFGFGKTVGRNWEILHNLGRLLDFGRPLLAALSRKRMIYEPEGLTPDTCAEQSVAAEKLAVLKGASIIRTHDTALHGKIPHRG